jgi:hypothetical protein
MSRRQAKRARFAHRQKVARIARRIHRANAHKPDYLGAAMGLTMMVGGKPLRLGPGAVFIKRIPVDGEPAQP